MRDISPEVRGALELLNVGQVCELLQVKRDWLYDQCAEGKIPHLRLGRSIRFRPMELQAYLAGEWRDSDG